MSQIGWLKIDAFWIITKMNTAHSVRTNDGSSHRKCRDTGSQKQTYFHRHIDHHSSSRSVYGQQNECKPKQKKAENVGVQTRNVHRIIGSQTTHSGQRYPPRTMLWRPRQEMQTNAVSHCLHSDAEDAVAFDQKIKIKIKEYRFIRRSFMLLSIQTYSHSLHVHHSHHHHRNGHPPETQSCSVWNTQKPKIRNFRKIWKWLQTKTHRPFEIRMRWIIKKRECLSVSPGVKRMDFCVSSQIESEHIGQIQSKYTWMGRGELVNVLWSNHNITKQNTSKSSPIPFTATTSFVSICHAINVKNEIWIHSEAVQRHRVNTQRLRMWWSQMDELHIDSLQKWK